MFYGYGRQIPLSKPLKKLWENEKMLVSGIFPYFPQCFLPYQRQIITLAPELKLSSENASIFDIHVITFLLCDKELINFCLLTPGDFQFGFSQLKIPFLGIFFLFMPRHGKIGDILFYCCPSICLSVCTNLM